MSSVLPYTVKSKLVFKWKKLFLDQLFNIIFIA